MQDATTEDTEKHLFELIFVVLAQKYRYRGAGVLRDDLYVLGICRAEVMEIVTELIEVFFVPP